MKAVHARRNECFGCRGGTLILSNVEANQIGVRAALGQLNRCCQLASFVDAFFHFALLLFLFDNASKFCWYDSCRRRRHAVEIGYHCPIQAVKECIDSRTTTPDLITIRIGRYSMMI